MMIEVENDANLAIITIFVVSFKGRKQLTSELVDTRWWKERSKCVELTYQVS